MGYSNLPHLVREREKGLRDLDSEAGPSASEVCWLTGSWCFEPFPERAALSPSLLFPQLYAKWSWHYHVPINSPDEEQPELSYL